MKQLFRTPLLVFVATNIVCFLFYISPFNNYPSVLPVLAIDTTQNYLYTSETGEQTLAISKTELISDNRALVFVGDIMLARHVEFLMDTYGYKYPFLNSQFLTEKPAVVVGNFEATIPVRHKKTPNFNFQFSVDKKYLRGLSETGFTHLSLANNHALDYGNQAYINSIEALAELNISTFGQPKTLGENTIAYTTASNTKFAIIGLNETQMDINQEKLKPIIEKASAHSDVQIAYIHWGEEYTHEPNQTQKTIAQMLAEAGVDLVIGHHPHVIQSIEKIDNTLVFYSLGNYIFDQYFSTDVKEGLAIRLEVQEERMKISLLPHSSAEVKAQPKLLEGQEREDILREIADYSDKNIAEMILAGELFTPLSLASSTEIAIMDQ